MKYTVLPYCHATSVYDIDIDFFVRLKTNYVLLDLDNTLDIHKTKLPSDRAIKLINDLKEAGLTPTIVSNNSKKRVKKYADALGCNYVYRCFKPFHRKILKYLLKNHINKENVIMIGDQLVTDIKCANRLNVKSILTEKLGSSDQFVTKFMKGIDTKRHKELEKNGFLIDWREVYGRIK